MGDAVPIDRPGGCAGRIMCNGSNRPVSRSGETIDSNTGWQPLPPQRVSIDHVTRRCDTVSPAQPGSPTTVESWSKASKLNPNMPRCSPTFKSDGTVRRNSRHFGVTWASASKRSSPKIPYHQSESFHHLVRSSKGQPPPRSRHLCSHGNTLLELT